LRLAPIREVAACSEAGSGGLESGRGDLDPTVGLHAIMGLTISILSARHGCNRARRFLFRNGALTRNKHDVRSGSAAVLIPD
jgi:hypothetical protein